MLRISPLHRAAVAGVISAPRFNPFAQLSTSKWNTVSKAQLLGLTPEQYKKIPAKDPRRLITPWSVLQDHFISLEHDPHLSLEALPHVETHLIPPQKAMMLLPSIKPAWVKVHPHKVADFCCLPATLKQLLKDEAKAQGIVKYSYEYGLLEASITRSRSVTYQHVADMLDFMHICERVKAKLLPGTEKKVDLAAMQWAMVNGFHNSAGFGLRIDNVGGELRLLGERSVAEADIYVCQTMTGDLVIIFEDKLDLHHHGGMPQIFGELLRMHYLNLQKHKEKMAKTVFGVRLCFSNLTAFALDATPQQVEAACLGRGLGKVPKMIMRSTVADPAKQLGWSLLEQQDRAAAIKLMTALRMRVGTG
jgi:hypothetical protein